MGNGETQWTHSSNNTTTGPIIKRMRHTIRTHSVVIQLLYTEMRKTRKNIQSGVPYSNK